MWNDTKVLLIDDAPQHGHDVKLLFEFLGREAEHFYSDAWLNQSASELSGSEGANLKGGDGSTLTQAPNAFMCVFLANINSARPLAKLIKKIADWDSNIPIVLIDAEVPSGLDDRLRGLVIESLPLAPDYTHLVEALHLAQMFRERVSGPSSGKGHQHIFKSLLGGSSGIKGVRGLMAQVADKDVNVLITGESGTGKEVVARNLHLNSVRRNMPFVPVNCGAIPSELLESELFGHEKGAFTGAISSRAGRFELAQGGTLFLDEIGDMPQHMQVKILRVLQERTFERVGGSKTLKADVRIIAATHQNLEEAIHQGTFREDLYYRLNVFPIEIPALRDRSEDIPLIVNELVMKVEEQHRGSVRFSSNAMMALSQYSWPGNVRELANMVERMSIMHPNNVIGVEELPEKFRPEGYETCSFEMEEDDSETSASKLMYAHEDAIALLPVSGINLKNYLGNLESNLIKQALDETNGVVARAAEKLNIRRTTLVEKMRKYELHRGDSSPNH